MSGYVGDLSPEQERLLQQFRDEVIDVPDQYDTSDHFYLRWLRAKNFHLDQALDMYQAHLKWRKVMKVDTILDDWEPPKVLEKYMPRGCFGLDRDGDPIIYEFFGHADPRGLYRSSTREDVIKMMVHYSEHLTRLLSETSKKQGRVVEQFTVIADMEGLSYERHFHWPSIQVLRELLHVLIENYPERIKRILIVHAPPIFPVAYYLVCYFIDEHWANKVFLCGSNWKEQLQKFIAPDQLPKVYGGTRSEPDPHCSSHLTWGGDVPKKYHLVNHMVTKMENMERVLLGRGSTHRVEVNVVFPGTRIRWEFIANNSDFGFGIFLKPIEMRNVDVPASEMTIVVPNDRKESHLPEIKTHQCDHVGTYVLQFDNTHSLTDKEVFYIVHTSLPSRCISEGSVLRNDIHEALTEKPIRPIDCQPRWMSQDLSSSRQQAELSSGRAGNNSPTPGCLQACLISCLADPEACVSCTVTCLEICALLCEICSACDSLN